jgi:hypothetical protein
MFNPSREATPSDDPVPADLRAVLELFSAELRGVAFPGVDAAGLGKHAEEVRARARDVERAQAALDAALGALGERTAALAALAGRALAYARVYAADNAELAARLADLEPAADRPAPTAAPRAPLQRRRRRAESPGLPLGDMGAASSEDATAEA